MKERKSSDLCAHRIRLAKRRSSSGKKGNVESFYRLKFT